MDLVGLVSGGKDSVYNMLEAVRLGHRVVCLANLHPGDASGSDGGPPQELDSWMYQTVGWNVVPVLAQAMGLPLHRHVTRGEAVHTGLSYPTTGGGGHGDEVEDLHDLLRAVVAAHPSVRGVAVGAILSSYQRLRVESVCARLGLLPVALLWQREQRGLLEDMSASGLRALLVKVASHGLTAEAHLGREVGALAPSLQRLNRQFGLHICGEGGEYETLTLDSPLHREGTVVVGESRVVASPRGGAAHLHITSAALQLREREGQGAAAAAPHPAGVLEWDWKGRMQQREPAGAPGAAGRAPEHPPFPPFCPPPLSALPREASARGLPLPLTALPTAPGPQVQGDLLFLTLAASASEAEGGAAAAAQALLEKLCAALAARGGALADVVNLHLGLSSMAHFPAVNAVFERAFWGAGAGGGAGAAALPLHPPSRSCVEFTPMQAAWDFACTCEAVCVIGSGRCAAAGQAGLRRTMLVASLSKWAPMCIGPYAQCVTVDDALVLPAGQIGLLPETMALVQGGVALQLQQALLNLARVCCAAGTGLPCAVSLIVYVSQEAYPEEGGGEEVI